MYICALAFVSPLWVFCYYTRPLQIVRKRLCRDRLKSICLSKMDELYRMIAASMPCASISLDEYSLNVCIAEELLATVQYYPPNGYGMHYTAGAFAGRSERTTKKIYVVVQLMRCARRANEEIFDIIMRHVAKEINAKNLFVDGTQALFIYGARSVRVKLEGSLVKIGQHRASLWSFAEISGLIATKRLSFAKGMPVSVFENHIARLKEEIAQIYPALAAAEEIQILNREKFAFGSLSWFILADDWKTSKKLRAANRICTIRADVAALLPQPIAEEMTPHLV